jgi:AAA domain (Cdc48 subfamily)
MREPSGPYSWQRALLHAMRTRSVIVLHGNVRDLYCLSCPPHFYERNLDETLVRLLYPTFGAMRSYDAYAKGAELSLAEGDVLVSDTLSDFGAPGFNATIESALVRVGSELVNHDHRSTWYLPYAHNLLPFRQSYAQEEHLRLIAMQRAIERMNPESRLLLSYLSDTQVPLELTHGAHRVAFVKIPLPDFDERFAFWGRRIPERLARDLARLTDGMAITSLQALVALAVGGSGAARKPLHDITAREWERAVAQYKFGDARDYYRQISAEQLDHAEHFFVSEEGVHGQPEAIQKTISMLWVARTNVASLLRSGPSTAPRGVMFCCGPSGVGKTLLSQKTAKFVFGSEAAFIRIDMSEYQQEHSVAGLIGAPAGYVGYERGGVLTNAVLERPFSVIVIDEVEKAAPRVFDLFLQILSDGRLTDSRGQTVFFSEAIIVFTSNIGARPHEAAQLEEARQSGDADRVRAHFVKCVQAYFRYELGRPELLNRIGDNIVPFSFLEDAQVLVQTVTFYLELLRTRFDEEHREKQLRLDIDIGTVSAFLVREYGSKIREFGGRAVLNILASVVLPELARQLLALELDSHSGPVTLRAGVVTEGGVRKVGIHV